jgi:hypothetical protein
MSAGFQIPGDLALSADERYLLLAQGAEEIAERVNVGLQSFAGTWIYDQTKGVKYLFEIFEKPASAGMALLRAEMWRVIGQTAGVAGVDNVTIEFESAERTARVVWQAHTDKGIVLSSQVVIS